MAGDWIKVEHWTPEKPEIYAMAEALGIDPDQVVGALVRLWIWADQQTTDGNAPSVTSALVDRKSGVTGFAAAMKKAGWLKDESGTLVFPNFDRHNGETAKSRALTAKRVAKCKQKSNAASVSSPLPLALPREEKRREENKESLSPAREDVPVFDTTIPTAAEVEQYAETLCYRIDGQAFLDHYAAAGWRHKGHPIADWRALVRTWKRREEERGYQSKTQPPRRLTAAERLAMEGPSNG